LLLAFYVHLRALAQNPFALLPYWQGSGNIA
jgi:hypothetical protein